MRAPGKFCNAPHPAGSCRSRTLLFSPPRNVRLLPYVSPRQDSCNESRVLNVSKSKTKQGESATDVADISLMRCPVADTTRNNPRAIKVFRSIAEIGPRSIHPTGKKDVAGIRFSDAPR